MPSKIHARGRGSRAAACRECGALREDGARISARGLCLECGISRNAGAAEQIAAGEGPFYEEWRRGMVGFLHDLERADS